MTALRPLALTLAATAAFAVLPEAKAQMTTEHHSPASESRDHTQNHPYVGMWVTADGRVRHELLPNGRYDEARGSRESAYQGRYEVTGTEIFYWDDTGFTADGVFVDTDTLHHGGMIFTRRR